MGNCESAASRAALAEPCSCGCVGGALIGIPFSCQLSSCVNSSAMLLASSRSRSIAEVASWQNRVGGREFSQRPLGGGEPAWIEGTEEDVVVADGTASTVRPLLPRVAA